MDQPHKCALVEIETSLAGMRDPTGRSRAVIDGTTAEGVIHVRLDEGENMVQVCEASIEGLKNAFNSSAGERALLKGAQVSLWMTKRVSDLPRVRIRIEI